MDFCGRLLGGSKVMRHMDTSTETQVFLTSAPLGDVLGVYTFSLGIPCERYQRWMIWTAKFNLDEFVRGKRVAACAKLLQGVGEKILDDRRQENSRVADSTMLHYLGLRGCCFSVISAWATLKTLEYAAKSNNRLGQPPSLWSLETLVEGWAERCWMQHGAVGIITAWKVGWSSELVQVEQFLHGVVLPRHIPSCCPTAESSYGFEPKQGVAIPLPACPLLFAHCGTVEEQGFEWTGGAVPLHLSRWMAVTRWMLDVNAGAARSSLRAYRGARGRTIEVSYPQGESHRTPSSETNLPSQATRRREAMGKSPSCQKAKQTTTTHGNM
ncbi:hypothetical protein F7725_012890 [Dissostichus mawsoni]|uniref:Uncharacterized protein n=1 Tax=Dissostichus mawsoni TaxID=36200 RepID=A0A7J5YS64_DISMA|nr:hypothetical protein F7725_012890 [Dissostichus mawsoni]